MIKLIPEKAEVELDHPDKPYIGTFEQSARFEAHLDEAGILLSLHRIGAVDLHKSVRIHFHYALFAEILHDLADKVACLPPANSVHREALRDAAKALYLALEADARGCDDESDVRKMTPDEEVLLLQIMERRCASGRG